MADFIVSKENKEVLWSVLYNNKLFNNIPQSNFNSIQHIFEKTIEKCLEENREIFNNDDANINSNINSKNNIINMNKIILQKIILNINNHKKTLLTPIEIKETLKIEKLEEFDKELNEKKVSFNELITLKKPEVIDFSDIKEEPITSNNMDELLERMQKERAINFPPLASVEVVDINTDLIIEDSIKNTQTNNIDYELLHSKIDTMCAQLAQLLANQSQIMEKLNAFNKV